MLAGGWTPEDGSVIHHRDGNTMNDALDNLEVLSRGAHRRLHGLGYSHRPESKRKISRALLGHPVSEETRRRIGVNQKGRPWSSARREAQLRRQYVME